MRHAVLKGTIRRSHVYGNSESTIEQEIKKAIYLNSVIECAVQKGAKPICYGAMSSADIPYDPELELVQASQNVFAWGGGLS